ncbi:MAG: hypothetical protein HQK54_11565 [Oligoflexales bacterium]|nr:hypothetical protein [Oligoflexales bacterium]
MKLLAMFCMGLMILACGKKEDDKETTQTTATPTFVDGTYVVTGPKCMPSNAAPSYPAGGSGFSAKASMADFKSVTRTYVIAGKKVTKTYERTDGTTCKVTVTQTLSSISDTVYQEKKTRTVAWEPSTCALVIVHDGKDNEVTKTNQINTVYGVLVDNTSTDDEGLWTVSAAQPVFTLSTPDAYKSLMTGYGCQSTDHLEFVWTKK